MWSVPEHNPWRETLSGPDQPIYSTSKLMLEGMLADFADAQVLALPALQAPTCQTDCFITAYNFCNGQDFRFGMSPQQLEVKGAPDDAQIRRQRKG